MDIVDVKLGAIVRARRKEMKMTQSDLAKKVGTTAQCIYYYEKGTRGMTMSTFFIVCRVLGLNPNEIQEEVSR